MRVYVSSQKLSSMNKGKEIHDFELLNVTEQELLSETKNYIEMEITEDMSNIIGRVPPSIIYVAFFDDNEFINGLQTKMDLLCKRTHRQTTYYSTSNITYTLLQQDDLEKLNF